VNDTNADRPADYTLYEIDHQVKKLFQSGALELCARASAIIRATIQRFTIKEML
jgi:hypothetical protein